MNNNFTIEFAQGIADDLNRIINQIRNVSSNIRENTQYDANPDFDNMSEISQSVIFRCQELEQRFNDLKQSAYESSIPVYEKIAKNVCKTLSKTSTRDAEPFKEFETMFDYLSYRIIFDDEYDSLREYCKSLIDDEFAKLSPQEKFITSIYNIEYNNENKSEYAPYTKGEKKFDLPADKNFVCSYISDSDYRIIYSILHSIVSEHYETRKVQRAIKRVKKQS